MEISANTIPQVPKEQDISGKEWLYSIQNHSYFIPTDPKGALVCQQHNLLS